MGVKEHIKELLATRKNIYSADPRIIIEDFRKEQEKIDEYNGRQLLELLQNADDAVDSSTNNKSCYISLNDNKLIVANNGKPFNSEGIESLMYSNLSPKMKEQNKIGHKGLGFRSVLSWANKVTIKSADFAVEFSKDIALDFLREVQKGNTNVKTIINDKTSENEENTIAILRCPKVLDNIPPEYSKYDTYIVIELKENQKKKVIEQIEKELDMEVLLFLNNLETIVVKYPNGQFTLKKEINGDSTSITRINNKDQIKKTWHVKTKSGKAKGSEDEKTKEKNYEIKIAWTDQLDDKKNTLYSNFKTNIKFPIPALVHATFDLTSDRNRLLPENEFNKGVKKALKDFLIEVADTIAKGEGTSYNALKLLCVEDNDILTQNELVDKIKDSDKKIFPTITDEYISYNDNPVFLQHDYASFIGDTEKSKFKTLLRFSDDLSIVNLLENMGLVKAPNDEIITNMSQLVLTPNSRAQLIYLLSQEELEGTAQKCLVQTLIDANGTSASQGDVVFLPPADGKSLVIPSVFPLKIMNDDLYKNLRSLFNESNAEVLASKMEMFGVKVYRFAEIFRSIVQKNASKFDKDLIQKLYELYISNKDTGADISIPSQQNIYVLNRKGEHVKTSDVYFGNEYSNDLCELLYQTDERKFVSSPDKLGLDGKEFVNNFLAWLGVANKPRYIIKALSGKDKKDYGNYVLDHYPFSEKGLCGCSKKEEFNKVYGIKSVNVTSIDGLEDILNNCSNEKILMWVLKDERIINNPRETEKESKTIFHKSYGKNNPTICNDDMASYLLWKLSRFEWMKTISNNKVAPYKCCISKSLTEDFSPLIEVPQIDYTLLKGFDKHYVEHVLHRIGVKTEIKDFSQQDIYSILNRLPDIDDGDKKARLLYRELVENLDEDDIDESLPERKVFIEKGKVFCKQENQYSFESVKDVYYLQDKIYGENIIKQFKTIAIDRRRNSTVVKRLFGVEPLANLKFSLKDEPKVNKNLNAELNQELQNLTPYVYALRSSNSKDSIYSKLCDKWSIKLCSEISPFYKKKDDSAENEFVLNDYEFVYVSEGNTYYVLIKDSYNSTLNQLKSDYKFVDVVSEIYSNILKVDSIRPLVSRLFEADKKKRDHILKTEIDDSDIKLKEAQRQLNIVSDKKVLFWLGVLETCKHKVEYKEYEKTELDCLVMDRINIQIDDYSIDYDDLATEDCKVSEIKKLFEELNIDIASFNSHSSCKLNLVPYYKKQLVKKKNDKESIFERLLYEQLQDKLVEKKMEFLSKIKDFNAYCNFKVSNDINVNIEGILNESISNEFSIDISTIPQLSETKSIYDENYNKLMKESELNCEEFMVFLNNSDENRSLVYFGEYDTIKKNYKIYKENIKAEDKTLFNGFQINDNNLSDAYKSFIEQQDLLKDIEIQGIKTEKTPSNNHNKHGQHGGQRKPKPMSDKKKKYIGFLGEVIVYEQLKKVYGEASVSWDSGYAKEANVNPLGDDMNHYDIRYKKNDEYYYVEVKSTTTANLEFEISELELEFGKEKKNNYEIFIVTNVESQDRKIKNIGNPFIFEEGESLMNCQRFTVQNDSFTIKMKEKK